MRALKLLWCAPTSLLGLAFIPLALFGDGRVRQVTGVLEVSGGGVGWLLRRLPLLRHGALAITLGHVVLGRDDQALELSREHERVHVRQAERWGPLFVPAYLLASLWQLVRGARPYLDNPFEREARRLSRPGGSGPPPPASSPPSAPPPADRLA